jgi:polyhydroxyalkanoate synthesis regulator phasin
MSLDKRKLEEVFGEAEMAFWDAVASSFPEIKSGDLSPSDSAKLEKAMKEAIQSWYVGNQPAGESTSQIVRNLERRVARLEKSSR